MPFGDKLQRMREAARLSQDDLASKAGLSLRSIQNWEQGHRIPKAAALLALSKALQCSPEKLLAELTAPPAKKPRAKAKGK
jgi:putative transcriptional regulator